MQKLAVSKVAMGTVLFGSYDSPGQINITYTVLCTYKNGPTRTYVECC